MSVNARGFCFFPPPPVLILKVEANWRARLRDAIERSGRKHSAIARDAGVAPETLSRILTHAHMRPSFETIVSIAHAVNENVGWLLDERGFALSADEQKQLRKVVRFLDDTLLGTLAPKRDRVEANAVFVGSGDIPRAYAVRGARVAYEASGDSMIGAGIADRDLLYVKPTRNMREAAGKIVVCRVDTADYVKVLDVRAGRTRLLSRNERYPPIELTEFELVGIVVGRSGALGNNPA